MKNTPVFLPISTDYTTNEDYEGIEYVYIWSKDGEGYGRIAYVYGECGESAKDTAEIIVTACNAHEALLEALKTTTKELEDAVNFVSSLKPFLTNHNAGMWDSAAKEAVQAIKEAEVQL